jgi:hypothetical protein
MDPVEKLGEGYFCPDQALRFSRLPVEVMTARNLPFPARLLYAYVIFRTGWPFEEKPIWFSVRRMAADLGLGRRSVERHLATLKSVGLIDRWTVDERTYTIPRPIDSKVIAEIDPTLTSAGGLRDRSGIRQMDGAPLSPEELPPPHMAGPPATGGGPPPPHMADIIRQRKETKDTDTPSRNVTECGGCEEMEKDQTHGGSESRRNLLDIADEVQRKKEKAEAKRRLRLQVRSHMNKAETFRGKGFCKFVQTMCGFYNVEFADFINPQVRHVPPRYAKLMNDALEKFMDGHGLSKTEVAAVLHKAVESWSRTSEVISHDGRLSIYMIRRHVDYLVETFHKPGKKRRDPRGRMPTDIPTFESADEMFGEEK